MKIAHIVPHYFTAIGGLQVCVHNICKRHVQHGASVYVFCCDRPRKNFHSVYTIKKYFNFKFITKAYPISKYLINYYTADLQKKYNFDLWQINGGYPYGALLADFFMKNDIPAVLRCSGDDIQIAEEFDYGVCRDPKINRIIIENYKKYRAVVAISETIKTEYEQIGVQGENIRSIPNGVDIERIKEFTASGNIRKKHKIPPDSVILLSVGRNHPKKGYSFIPGILRRVLDQHLDVYWIIIGKGVSRVGGREVLGEDKERLILIDEISFSSNKYDIPSDELIQYYKSANLFAMTSVLETFGIVLVEAMAAGLPVVCFDAPGVRDVMNLECGIMCKCGDAESFARAIVEIAAKKDRADFATLCLEHANRYSWDIIADQYLRLYKSLVA